MKILATIKPVNYLSNKETFAYLIEVDFISTEIVRKLRIPAAAFKTKSAFMTNFAQGITIAGNKIFVTCWNFIVVIDYESFTIIDSFSHPYMVDLHGIDNDGENLYVTSTAIDSVLCFDINTFDLKWRWGPDENILTGRKWLLPIPRCFINKKRYFKIFTNKLGLYNINIKYKFNEHVDYRHIHKTRSPYHFHHLNDIKYYNGNLYISTGNWNGSLESSLIEILHESGEARFVSKPGSIKAIHDIVFFEKNIYVTESRNNTVAIVDKVSGSVSRIKVENKKYFVRGLCEINNTFVVGFSTMRNTKNEAKLVQYDLKLNKVLNEIDLGNMYSDKYNSAVHAIQPYLK